MITGKQITIKVKEMLNEARNTGRNLYFKSSFPDGNPLRIISVKTERGLTVAYTPTGSNVPVSDRTLDRLYIQ